LRFLRWTVFDLSHKKIPFIRFDSSLVMSKLFANISMGVLKRGSLLRLDSFLRQ